MLKLGLTGGLGTGKTAVAELLLARHVPVLDTDELAREFTRPGQPALRQIAECFGANVLDEHGALRRGAMAERVFGHPEERARLEQILHPPIREAWQRQLADWQAAGEPVSVVVIPLLYETACEGAFDYVICTACSAGTQRERLRQRGWTDAQIDGRLAAQLPLKTKLERANFVIWTEGAMASTGSQLDEVLRKLGVVAAEVAPVGRA
jgi:dephospho-CoA kinase